MYTTSETIINKEHVTDRDIFEYVKQQMINQNRKSMDSYFDEEEDEMIEGDTCQYFGYDYVNEISIRCALGHLMQQEIFNDLSCEETDAFEEDNLKVIAASNVNWQITTKSWMMLCILQRIHDVVDVKQWSSVMNNMTYLFNPDGSFDYNSIENKDFKRVWEKKTLGESIDEQESKEKFTLDLEDFGLSIRDLQVPSLELSNSIFDFIKQDHKDIVNQVQLNVMQAESQKQQKEADSFFLDMIDTINSNIKKNKEKVEV
jgi:hypothetical protein